MREPRPQDDSDLPPYLAQSVSERIRLLQASEDERSANVYLYLERRGAVRIKDVLVMLRSGVIEPDLIAAWLQEGIGPAEGGAELEAIPVGYPDLELAVLARQFFLEQRHAAANDATINLDTPKTDRW